MTSKSSFWVDLKENNKRRVWLWVVSWLFFLLFYVAGGALVIVGAKNGMPDDITGIMLNSAMEQQVLREAVSRAIVFGWFTLMLVAAVMAIVCAVQGFAYLYQPKQVDFIHSQPVGKGRRFAVIWLNGLLIYLLPSLVGVFGGALVVFLNGGLDSAMWASILLTYLRTLLLFMALYHLNIVAVMLTGHVLITLFAVGILQCYEFLLRGLWESYMTLFFQKYIGTRGWGGTVSEQMWLSPYAVYGLFSNAEVYDHAIFLWGMLVLFLQGLLFGGIAYLLYRKRPAEAAGRAMAFPVTKPIVKMAVAVPVTLAAALFIKVMTSGYREDATSGSFWFITFTIVATAAIICGLIEVIYQFDIKACLRKKKHILLCAGAAALLFLGFRFDVTGYDAYIPTVAQVDSYTMVFDSVPIMNANYYDEKIGYVNSFDYASENMFLTDAEAICRLAAIQQETSGVTAQVKYRLKGGRTEERLVFLDLANPETIEILDRIVGTPEYKKGAAFITGDYFDRWYQTKENVSLSATYRVGIYSAKIPDEAVAQLTEAYRRDLEFIDYTDISQNPPLGYIQFLRDVKADNMANFNNYTQHCEIALYPDCTQTVAGLKELGMYREAPVQVEDIEHIEVTYDNRDETMVERYGAERADYEIHYVTADYAEPAEISAIVEAIWPIEDYRLYQDLVEDQYHVTVYFKRGSQPYENHQSNYYYSVVKGKLPLFVIEDTRYVPESGSEDK